MEQSIKECLEIAKVEVSGLKKVEETFKDLYAALVEKKETIKTEDGIAFLDAELKATYKDLIEIGVGIGKMEGLINAYESMANRGIFK